MAMTMATTTPMKTPRKQFALALLRRSTSVDVLLLSALVLFLGIGENIITLSVTVTTAGNRHDQQENLILPQRQLRRRTTAETSTTTTAARPPPIETSSSNGVDYDGNMNAIDSTKTSTTTAPFPRWNDANGIQWDAIEAYIRHADAHLTSGNDLLECRNGGCPTDMPNVLYIFGVRPSAMENVTMIPSSDTTDHIDDDDETPKVWVERRRRKLVGPGFSKRYPIMEELMERSLEYLLANEAVATKQYPRLRQYINNGAPNNPSLSSFQGIPLIMNFGDNRQCHSQNLKRTNQQQHQGEDESTEEESWHNVPVFTLAVPTDCHFAFPIPHPAALDTAKVYGDRWESILDRRRRTYPYSNQTLQAIWRGSPTGWPMVDKENHHDGSSSSWTMRQQMVYTANHLPYSQDDELNDPTLMEQVHRALEQVVAPSAAETASSGALTTTTTSSSHDDITSTSSENENNKNNGTSVFNVGFGKPFHKIVPSYKGPRIPRQSRIWFEDFAKYRVVLDADGSSWSERLGPLLCLNTIVAKLDPSFVDWLWPSLEPNVHYVPIEKDSSNLWSSVLPFLLEGDDRDDDDDDDDGQESGAATTSAGQKITQQAQQWCAAHMTYERMIQGFLQSLERYVEWLDRGDADWSSKWQQLLVGRQQQEGDNNGAAAAAAGGNMPPQHHHWQSLPLVVAKNNNPSQGQYFPLWRDDEAGTEYKISSR